MAESEHEWISRRAYTLWEEEGYPTGKDSEHWERARQEYLLFAPLGEAKGLPKGKKPKANGSSGDVAVRAKPAAGKSGASRSGAGKSGLSKSSSGKSVAEKADADTVTAGSKAAKPGKQAAVTAETTGSAPAKSKAGAAGKVAKPAKIIAAKAKPAVGTRSKKLAAE